MNHKHLHYFWTVARLGGVSRAAEQLDLTPQTISGQLRQLENELGAALFRPSGRGLELTDAGRMALSYADERLHLESEMKQALLARQ
uniref:LysR family transcriptional regulator n=1 Tax=Zoogloea sp. TaxID=49181 RepID=UPI0037DA5FE8